MEKLSKVKKLTLAGLLIALGVVCSAFYIPVGVAKCFPVQHMINVVAGVVLGPWYAVAMAFVTSCIRVFSGTGSLLAFPGSMFGALLCGIFYKYKKTIPSAVVGEVMGTGIIGALVSYPVSVLLMGSETAALFGFVLPFSVSSAGGALLSAGILFALIKTRVFHLSK